MPMIFESSTEKQQRILLVVLLFLTACGGAQLSSPTHQHADESQRSTDKRNPVSDGFLIRKTWPKELDLNAFERLKNKAKEEQTTALVLIHNGELIHASNPSGKGTWYQPSIAMSVTKSVVAILMGRLVDSGLLTLDQPLSETILPEWKNDARKEITLKHLLNHTSGLDPERALFKALKKNKSIRPFYFESTGLEAELKAPVGTAFTYNNMAVDFLSVVVKRLYPKEGYRLDDAMQSLVFHPLGVLGAKWWKDDGGDPGASGELVVRPIDLAKVGQLILQQGMWQNERLLSESWIKTMLAQGSELEPGCGLLWWRKKLSKDTQQPKAYAATGYLGQYIVVVPELRLVAVRMRDPKRTNSNPKVFEYTDFIDDVLALAPR